MEQPTHIIDPDGEVMIVLSNANAPFASEAYITEKKVEKDEDEDEDEDYDKSTEFGMSEMATSASGVRHNEQNNDKKSDLPRFCIQVSAKHLTSASPLFKKAFTSSWKESITFLQKGSVEIITGDWDIEAFLILLRIMHCQFNQMPRKLTVEMLAKVAFIADYFECKDVMGLFMNIWVEALDERLPGIYCRDLVLWLWISWAFRYEKRFHMITATAMSHSNGVISNFGLPIPDRVIESMNRHRHEGIEEIVDLLHEKHEALLDGKLGCGFECSSIMYGALTKELKSHAMLSPRPSRPFQGLNYSQLVKHDVNLERVYVAPTNALDSAAQKRGQGLDRQCRMMCTADTDGIGGRGRLGGHGADVYVQGRSFAGGM
ncbi:uncharacterized protein BHQ10_008401 [Talaromyces amestolkiae]|uniref:Uncharacterized protein n=1 Tax=Talaromyces amestolkiae TaxID=1196081 RepID=A0A364L9D1_TALAM|nr:uncharacterized protein BHQ10_008401 [Talaromyces amestolkiae]RAO72389.1 hypothetical protein BHQ10_008401 [Talaromyces amestolkiae]